MLIISISWYPRPGDSILWYPRPGILRDPQYVISSPPGHECRWYPWGRGDFESDAPPLPRPGGSTRPIWTAHYPIAPLPLRSTIDNICNFRAFLLNSFFPTVWTWYNMYSPKLFNSMRWSSIEPTDYIIVDDFWYEQTPCEYRSIFILMYL